ncbi:MAG: aminotransferase class V-fold PLP-dependent enzyme [Myxococcota bacterium]
MPRNGFDVERVRRDFPILERSLRGQPLAYLDNAATAQKPRVVIDAVADFYRTRNANVHRAVYALAEKATAAYEQARSRVADFLGAADPRQIVFVRGTTEAINLVAQSFARPRLKPGDEILISHMEHHSNIVPWQLCCQQTGAVLRVAPINDRGEIDVEAFERLLGPRTRMVALAHVSNALGTINPVETLIPMAHAHGAPVLLDGAQAAPHLAIDVRALGCNFYTLSGHKLYGPTGIGALFGTAERLESMEPYQGGGEMIASVSFEHTTYADVPYRFEAGTPNIAGAVGLGRAIEYLGGLDREGARTHEDSLLEYASKALGELHGIRIIGRAEQKTAVLSFVVEGVHPHDVSTILDQQGVAVRAGHHCAEPVMKRFGILGTTRASFGIYNTRPEVDRLMAGLEQVREIFG